MVSEMYEEGWTELRQRMLAQLRELEWSGCRQGPGYGPMGSGGDGDLYPACPRCGGLQRSSTAFVPEAVGHRPDCSLAALIRDMSEI